MMPARCLQVKSDLEKHLTDIRSKVKAVISPRIVINYPCHVLAGAVFDPEKYLSDIHSKVSVKAVISQDGHELCLSVTGHDSAADAGEVAPGRGEQKMDIK